MKKILIILMTGITIIISTNDAKAQCKEGFLFTASRTVYLDSSNNEVRTVDESTTIRLDSNGIQIAAGDDGLMTGKITNLECKWPVSYKEGLSTFKSTISNDNGNSRSVTFQLNGKDGVITMIATLDNDPNKRLRLVAEKFSSR